MQRHLLDATVGLQPLLNAIALGHIPQRATLGCDFGLSHGIAHLSKFNFLHSLLEDGLQQGWLGLARFELGLVSCPAPALGGQGVGGIL